MIGKKQVVACFTGLMLTLMLTAPALSVTITWTNQGERGNWDVQTNWSPNQVPGPDDDVVHGIGGAGIIEVNIADAECKTFTATAGGSPLRGLRIMPYMKLTVGIPNNPPPGDRHSFRVFGQTEQVRYLTELKEFAQLETQHGDGFGEPDEIGTAGSGDLLLRTHSFLKYGGGSTYLRGAVWTMRGGRFWTMESDDAPIGPEGQGG